MRVLAALAFFTCLKSTSAWMAFAPSRRETSLSLKPNPGKMGAALQSAFLATALVASTLSPALPAYASESRIVGQIAGSGLVFKDTLQVEVSGGK